MKPKHCPHCGASIAYYGRRDLMNHIGRVVARLDGSREHNWGEGFALGYLEGTLSTALGLCSSPGCSATTTKARQAFLDQMRADDEARNARIEAYLAERKREREGDAPIQPDDLQAPDLARGFVESEPCPRRAAGLECWCSDRGELAAGLSRCSCPEPQCP